jgi:[acyl-carrier-protein] S-malonyltransferase
MDAAAATQPGGLVALRGLSRRKVAALCEDLAAHIAIAVAEDAYVVGGTTEALVAVGQRAEARSARVTCLKVGVASHTPLLAAAVAPFRAALQESHLASPRIPVIAGIDAVAVITRAQAIATLAASVAQTIEWGQCLDTLYELGCRVMLELGPGRALSRMVRERFDDVEARAVEEFSGPGAVAQWVARRRG